MGIIVDLFSNQPMESTVSLAGANEGRRVTIKVDKKNKNMNRVAKDELELVYAKDAITFNSVNKTVQMLMSSQFYIHAAQKRTVTFFESFFNNIGNVGEKMTTTELLENIFSDICKFGDAYVEIIYDEETQTKPLDLARVDSKRMDVARDVTGYAVTDMYGSCAGYTMSLPAGMVATGDEVPKEFRGKIELNNKIFLKPERIVRFSLYNIQDGFSSLGLIEPSYQSVMRKMAITEAQTNSIYTRGTYPVIAYTGNPDHEPTPDDIDKTLNLIKEMKHDRYFAFPYWTKVEPLEVKQSDVIDKTLDFLRQEQSAALGMPLAFATGAGEATNRATLTNQQEIMQLTLRDIMKKVLSTWNKFIMRKISQAYGLQEAAELRSEEIGAEEKNEKATRIQGWISSGVIKPESVSTYATYSEGLQNRENDRNIYL